jgi:neurotrimin
VRHRDIHILTAGAYTYTSDQRFQALHKPNSGSNNEWSEWTLCIKWAQERDEGIYECQISTIPLRAHQYHLNVVGKKTNFITLKILLNLHYMNDEQILLIL